MLVLHKIIHLFKLDHLPVGSKSAFHQVLIGGEPHHHLVANQTQGQHITQVDPAADCSAIIPCIKKNNYTSYLKLFHLDFGSVPGKYTAKYLARVSGQGRVMNWDHQRDTTCDQVISAQGRTERDWITWVT